MTQTLRYAFTENGSLTPGTESPSTTPILSITRATIAKYRDNTGTVQTAASGEARFNHTASGTALGLLVEPSRTNIALHSNDWTNAVYDTVTNITPLKDATGPDGVANSASTLTATADNGVISQSITAVSAARTTSVWMKRKTGTGTVEITDNGFTNATDITADINSSTWTQVGNITRTQANPVVGIRLGTSGDEVEVAYLQVEGGSFATSPIETTTALAMRNADIVTTDDTSWYTSSAATFYLHFHHDLAIGSRPDTYPLLCYTDSSNEIRFWSRTNDNFQLLIDDGGVNQVNAVTVTDYSAGEHRFAFGLSEDNYAGYFDGTAGETDSSATLPEISDLYVGSGSVGGNVFTGHIAEIRYYNERLDNTGIENLSNGLFPVPDVTGLTQAAATTLLLANGFVVATGTAVYSPTVAVGSVVSQDDVAGAYVANGTTVTIVLSLGPEPGGGRSKKGRKYSVEIDEEIFLFDTIAEAQEFLLLTRETAEVAAQKELQRAEKTKTPVKVPRVKVKLITGKPSASKALADAQADAERAIQEAYQKAAEARIQKLAQIARDIPGKGIATRADMSRKAKEKRQKQLDELEALIALLL